MTDHEIVRRLRLVRHSPVALRQGRKATSIRSIAIASNLSREYLFRIANGEPFGPVARAELIRVLSSEGIGRARAPV